MRGRWSWRAPEWRLCVERPGLLYGGGRVQGMFYSPKSCFEKALELNPRDANAWCNLGNLGGNASYMEMACYLKALAVDPQNAVAWYNLGLHGGLQGMTEGQCFRKAKKEFEGKLQVDAASLSLSVTEEDFRSLAQELFHGKSSQSFEEATCRLFGTCHPPSKDCLEEAQSLSLSWRRQLKQKHPEVPAKVSEMVVEGAAVALMKPADSSAVFSRSVVKEAVCTAKSNWQLERRRHPSKARRLLEDPCESVAKLWSLGPRATPGHRLGLILASCTAAVAFLSLSLSVLLLCRRRSNPYLALPQSDAEMETEGQDGVLPVHLLAAPRCVRSFQFFPLGEAVP
ncbi:CYC8 [Symbiodinium sp. CCMP2456]|nr:CYC8 [Symbiodinium sp. CCMP2456]